MEQGRLLESQGDHKEAKDAYKQALQIFTSIQKNVGICEVHSAIAEIYQTQTEYDQVLFHLEEALKHTDVTKPTPRIATINRLMGQAYIHLGN